MNRIHKQKKLPSLQRGQTIAELFADVERIKQDLGTAKPTTEQKAALDESSRRLGEAVAIQVIPAIKAAFAGFKKITQALGQLRDENPEAFAQLAKGVSLTPTDETPMVNS